ncbi:LVIVD repeat-containing protein [Spongiimicrobium salis]|uniref:LVIVD repeat-containing protein n=1 Tax=Spongiimicrobium salis TaxID=1667022 RepID=UPI00374CE664
MKTKPILLMMVIALMTFSCTDNEAFRDVIVAKPLTIKKSTLKGEVTVIAPTEIKTSGKIYAYKNYVFVNDLFEGIHVIDNTIPAAPQKIAFIEIAGNVDISIKDDFLYADNLTDLIVLDISDIQNIQTVNRLENVLEGNFWALPEVNFQTPVQADFFDYSGVDFENDVIIGWETRVERRPVEEVNAFFDNAEGDIAAPAIADNPSTVGQGGSLARFVIAKNHLYAVGSHTISTFDIENLEAPQAKEQVYAGFDIETIFNRGEHLFLGSQRGMYIYDISSPATPTFVSEFQHGTACDPVVVDGDYAYVTLRGGNNCGATESGLFIVDISDITQPTLKTSYPMDSPYGLGIRDEKVFVCDGASGLKVYDKTDVENLLLLDHFENIDTFDVIPRSESLLMIGAGILYQYRYLENTIELISELPLQ